MATLHNRLKAHRQKRCWSQAELAEKAGISRTAVSAIEGRRLVPSVAAALSLAAVLDVSVEDLFGPEKLAETGGIAWAWPPAVLPCRYWQARVGRRTLAYPAEPSEAGLIEHDGLLTGKSLPSQAVAAADRTLVMACCDPAAGLLARRLAQIDGIRLIVLTRTSREALALLGQGLIHVAGIHLTSASAPEGNAEAVRAQLGPGYCLLRLAHWQEGLALAPHAGPKSIRAAVRAPLRWVGREPGSGARQCLDELLGERAAPRHMARDHRGVAESIRCGWADAGVCLRLSSEEAGLRFLGIREEAFDLCFPAADRHEPCIAALVKAVRSPAYRRLLGELPGYDSAPTGELEEVRSSMDSSKKTAPAAQRVVIPRPAFTLVELLVVTAIVAVLIGLLVPAVQRVRESAARMACQNNLKQIGMAVHHYVSSFGVVPTEGNAPVDNGGPGDDASVFFNLLPYLEQDAIHGGVGGPGQNQIIPLFLCPSDSTSDGTPPAGAGTGVLALGSYNYNVAVPGDPNTGVFPEAANPPARVRLAQAMPDGSSGTIMVGEHVQWCGGLAGAGGGPGGPNPWGTIANKRVFGSTMLGQRKALAVGVNRGICTPPPGPPPGVAWFSAAHPQSLHFLMGDGSVQSCTDTIDVNTVLIPALTSGAGDVFSGFDS